MRTRLILGVVASILFIPLVNAQLNDKGKVHLSIGSAFGGHATEYDRTAYFTVLGFQLSNRQVTESSAATTTFPIEVHVGLAPVISVGAYYEPGLYVDSNDTQRNKLHLIGIQPRFYMINKDRFAWLASLQFGTMTLRIEDDETTSSSSRFSGTHFGLGSGVIFQFTDLIGLQLHLRYISTRSDLKEFELNGSQVPTDQYDGELRTSGAAFQAALCFRF